MHPPPPCGDFRPALSPPSEYADGCAVNRYRVRKNHDRDFKCTVTLLRANVSELRGEPLVGGIAPPISGSESDVYSLGAIWDVASQSRGA